jgi:hypothetical protein
MLSQVRTIGAGIGVGVGVGVGSAVGVGVGVGSGNEVGVGVGVTTGEGFFIATPLFQTSFVPDLMHVNFFPDAVAVDPAFEHLAPAFGAAACSGVAMVRIKTVASPRYLLLCMS